MSSLWQQHRIEDRVIEILREVEHQDHHFGRPFLTAYQLAIEFDRRHHEIVAQLGKEVGGAGTGEHTSLAQYLALELSRLIRDNQCYSVEGAFISSQDECELSYQHGHRMVTSSVTSSGYGLSMFRLR